MTQGNSVLLGAAMGIFGAVVGLQFPMPWAIFAVVAMVAGQYLLLAWHFGRSARLLRERATRPTPTEGGAG